MAKIPTQRLRFFDHQLLGVSEFNDEQAYHMEMRQLHNRLLHTWGIADGLEIRYAPEQQQLTVEEGTAIDAEGREIVLEKEQALDLSGFVGKTVYVTIAYGEDLAGPVDDGVTKEYGRWVSAPRIERSEAPPQDAGLQLVLGRVFVNDQGEAKADAGDDRFRRRQAGSKAGDIQVKGVTLTGLGTPEEWPRLETTGRQASRLTGSLGVDSTLTVGGDLAVAGGTTVAGSLGAGTEKPEARLHVVSTPGDSNTGALIVGPTDGPNLRMGHAGDHSWIQSHGSKPLRINEIGNDVLLSPGGAANVGIGTALPTHRLHVLADDAVGLFESRGSMAYLRVATREGFDNRVELANRPGGRLSLWTAGGGDVVNVTRDGRLGIGTEYPTHRFHVRADDPVALFESIGPQAYLRVASREGMDNRVELANRPGGRLALWVAGGGDALSITRDGAVGVGVEKPAPGARLHVAGDLVVDGEIRSQSGAVPVSGGGGGGFGASPWQPVSVGIGFQGSVGVGTLTPEAKLQVLNNPTDSSGTTLVVGPINGANLRLGYSADYAWIQSHGRRPLRINELGNDVLLNLGGGNVGIGTQSPQGRLHVAGDLVVDGQIRTPQGAVLPGGGGGAPVAAAGPWQPGPDGLATSQQGIRVLGNIIAGPLSAGPAVGRIEASGPTAEVSLIDRTQQSFGGRRGDRFVWYNHDRRLRLYTEELGDLLAVDAEGNMGVGTPTPQAKLHVKGDLLVEGTIRTPQGAVSVGGQPAAGGAAPVAPLHLVAPDAPLHLEAPGDGVRMVFTQQGGQSNWDMGLGGGRTLGARDFWIGDGRAVHFAIQDGSGNTGVGTNAPQAKFHVKGDVLVEGTIRTPQGPLTPGAGGGTAAPSPWEGAQGGIKYKGGNVGIGVDAPAQQLTITDGLGFANQNAADKKLWSPADGLLRWQTHNSAGAHGFEVGHQGDPAAVHLDTKGNSWLTGGNVGIGTNNPLQQLTITGGLGFANQNAADKRLWSPADGLLRWQTHNSAGAHGFEVGHQGDPAAVHLDTQGNSWLTGGNVGVGTSAPEARLQVINAPQDSGGNTLILGPTNAANLRMGYAADYSWIQSHGNKPLRINEIGNDVLIAAGGSNVGVGTLTPQAKLHVKGDIFVEGNVRTPAGVLGAGGGGASPWGAVNGGIAYKGGNVGIGHDAPNHVLHVKTDGAVGLLESTSNTAFLRLSVNDGMDNRVELANRGGGRLSLWVAGAGDAFNILRDGKVGIGTQAPSHAFHVKTDGAVGLFESSSNNAFLRVSTSDGIDNRVELCNRGGGRLALWTAGGSDVLNITRDGKVGIGTTTPASSFHSRTQVTAGPYSFGVCEGRIEANGPIAELSFSRRDLQAPRSQAGDRYVWYNSDGNARLWTEGVGDIVLFTPRGDVEVNSLKIRSGAKPGYVYDHFVNMAGDEVEQGDVVIIGEGDVTRYWATGNTIPIPEVDLCERAYDTRVCGIVDSVTRADDLPHAEAQEAGKGKRGRKKADSDAHPLQDLGATEEGATAVGEGQLGKMVTLGAYAFCKVDADIAPIVAGDLLTTSPTKGHAQKAVDRAQAQGAIIGKALGSLAKGKGKIPVMVLMQ